MQKSSHLQGEETRHKINFIAYMSPHNEQSWRCKRAIRTYEENVIAWVIKVEYENANFAWNFELLKGEKISFPSCMKISRAPSVVGCCRRRCLRQGKKQKRKTVASRWNVWETHVHEFIFFLTSYQMLF